MKPKKKARSREATKAVNTPVSTVDRINLVILLFVALLHMDLLLAELNCGPLLQNGDKFCQNKSAHEIDHAASYQNVCGRTPGQPHLFIIDPLQIARNLAKRGKGLHKPRCRARKSSRHY